MIQYLEAAAGEMSPAGSMLGMILPLVFCGIIFYFFLFANFMLNNIFLKARIRENVTEANYHIDRCDNSKYFRY